MAGATGLEPAASGVTGRRSNQLNYAPAKGSQECNKEATTRQPPAEGFFGLQRLGRGEREGMRAVLPHGGGAYFHHLYGLLVEVSYGGGVAVAEGRAYAAFQLGDQRPDGALVGDEGRDALGGAVRADAVHGALGGHTAVELEGLAVLPDHCPRRLVRAGEERADHDRACPRHPPRRP